MTKGEAAMQQQEMNRVRLDEMRGAPVHDNAGEKIGKVEEIYYDQQTRVPEWIGIGTGFFGTKRVLVPVKGTQVSDLVAIFLQRVSGDEEAKDFFFGGQALVLVPVGYGGEFIHVRGFATFVGEDAE